MTFFEQLEALQDRKHDLRSAQLSMSMRCMGMEVNRPHIPEPVAHVRAHYKMQCTAVGEQVAAFWEQRDHKRQQEIA